MRAHVLTGLVAAGAGTGDLVLYVSEGNAGGIDLITTLYPR